MGTKNKFFQIVILAWVLSALAACAVKDQGGAVPRCVPVAGLDGDLFGVMCGRGAVTFQASAPEGWRADGETADRLGTGVMFLAGGTSFDDAPAVLYPRVYVAEGVTQEEAARAEAEKTARDLRDRGMGGGPVARGPVAHASAGEVFTLYFFDDGPAPNEYEVSAYLLHRGLLLEFVLSARAPDALATALPGLYAVLDGVMISEGKDGSTR